MTPRSTDPARERRWQALDAHVAAEQARLHVPGAAVGVLDGGAEHVACFGVTNANHPLPVDGDTLFQIGSTTKTVTATALLQLVERGRLDLDAPLRTYLPELRLRDAAVAQQVTARHLLTHTGGWVGDYFADFGAGDDALARIAASMAELEQLTPLGSLYSYNNAGFYLAGRLVEVLAGQPYEQAARELVLDPLGMGHSFYFAHEIMAERFVVGHFVRDDGPEVALPWALARTANPAGGLLSSVRDQLRYARFWLGDGTAANGTRVLSPASMREMQRPQAQMGLDASVGLAWMLRDADGVRIVAHGGATRGQISAFVMAPERRFAITVLTNADHGSELCNSVTAWALRELLGLHEPETTHLPASEPELAALAGTYTAALSDLELRLEAGALMLHVAPKAGFPTRDAPALPTPEPMRVAVCGPDRIVVLDAPLKASRGEFLRGPDGAIAWLRFGGRVRRRLQERAS